VSELKPRFGFEVCPFEMCWKRYPTFSATESVMKYDRPPPASSTKVKAESISFTRRLVPPAPAVASRYGTSRPKPIR